MPRKAFRICLDALLLALFAVHGAVGQANAAPSDGSRSGAIEYAKGFTAEQHRNYTLLTVSQPWPGAQQELRYLLVHRGAAIPAGYPGIPVILVPVRSIVELSSTYLAETVELGEVDKITGVESLSYVYSPEVRSGIIAGRIKTVGEGQSLNIEELIKMNPDVIMTSAFGGASDLNPKLQEAGLPVVVNGDWAEPTPLGRAEWIKFIALFFDEGAKASRIFDGVASEYHRLAALAASTSERPTVFVNAPWQGTWTMPGGQSYMAQLFRDAGARYLWANNDSSGTLTLDFEAVFSRASRADYWINPGSWTSLSDALASDPRFAAFDAFRRGHLYNNTARITADGGNDYWESGPANPQRVLADLIQIFHPGLLVHRQLYYYEELK
ncbi:MAG TPA: ABC transporter substrate-binding protein [Spirochaetia bacterium]|nr:ABC transporter substrate-binding protein [Spirochaetia bacterium]